MRGLRAGSAVEAKALEPSVEAKALEL